MKEVNRQTEANKRWAEKNKEHAKYLSNRSRSRSFIKNQATIEDLEELEKLIRQRKWEEKQMQYWYNKNTNTLLNGNEYDEMIQKEAQELWNDEDNDAQDNFDSFEDFKKSLYESEDDFVPSDAEGNELAPEEW